MDMGIRKTVGSIFSVVGGIGAVVYFLEAFGFITLPLVKGAEYLADYFGALALVVFFLCTLWGGYQIGIWRSKKSVSASANVEPQPRAVTAKMQPKLDELETGLFEVMLERPAISSSTSGDTYINKIPFQQRVNKYIRLEAEAEHLLGVRHDDFYVNPDRLEASQSNWAHITDLAYNLLQKVKESRATIQTYADAVAQRGPVMPIIRTRRAYHRSEIYDPTREYLQAYLFYPFWHFIPLLSKLMGWHRDLWNYPRERIVVNMTTKKAYPLCGPDGDSLIVPIVRIRCNGRREPFPYSHLDRWCLKRGWEFIDQTPTRQI